MPVERREQAIDIESGQPMSGPTRGGRNPMFNGRRQPSRGGTSRMMREYQVRICERLGVKLPGPTRLVSRACRSKRHVQLYERWRWALRVRQSGVDLKPPQAAVVKSHGGERCGKTGTRFRQARLREASASELPAKCRKRSDDAKIGGRPFLR